MRPYKIQNKWIDLDHVQSISEPRWDDIPFDQQREEWECCGVVFEIEFAFRDNPEIVCVKVPTDSLKADDGETILSAYEFVYAPKDENSYIVEQFNKRVSEKLAEARKDIWNPLFEAWTNQKTGDES